MPAIDRLCKIILESGASDLHLAQGQPPKMRVNGSIKKIEDAILEEVVIEPMLSEICTDDRWEHFQDTGDLDFAYAFGDDARFRCNYHRTCHGYGAVLRIIPTEILSIQDLKLPPVLLSFADLNGGLVLVTGPTGSGKSTTLAAIIDFINRNSARHILTIEEPIEFVHPNKKSIIVQREVGIDASSFEEALQASGHADCDVILVGEMRDLETISQAISAAEAGHLVFATLHTNSAAKTLDRIISVFPADQQPQIRTMLSESLKAVCSQLLLKKKDGGRVAVVEILIQNTAVSNIIREGSGALHKLQSVMMSGKAVGMQIMDDVIEELMNKQVISGHEAYMKSIDKERFDRFRDAN